MKATFDLPDDLLRSMKIRAAEEGRKLKDVVTDLLRRGLDHGAPPPVARSRVRLPLVACGHPARPGEELTPEKVAEVLLTQEVARALGPVR